MHQLQFFPISQSILPPISSDLMGAFHRSLLSLAFKDFQQDLSLVTGQATQEHLCDRSLTTLLLALRYAWDHCIAETSYVFLIRVFWHSCKVICSISHRTSETLSFISLHGLLQCQMKIIPILCYLFRVTLLGGCCSCCTRSLGHAKPCHCNCCQITQFLFYLTT